jgi:GNAT superfamily N-acetyltransferase
MTLVEKAHEQSAGAAGGLKDLLIRPFDYSDADYAEVVAIDTLVYPEYPSTIEEWKDDDAKRDPKCQHQRFVAVHDGMIVGFASYGQHSGMYHPQRFNIGATVLPEHQGRGIGKALYAMLLNTLASFEPLSLRTNVREDMTRGVRFLQARGFVEDMKSWESRLHVPGFDFAPYVDAEAKMLVHGHRVATLAELMARDPDHRRKLYELIWACEQDVPHPEPQTKPDFEFFEKRHFESPNLLPEACFIALDGDEYIGLSELWASQADASELYTGLTGVRRDYRRRGVALALKLRAIAYARAHGVTTVKTWNEQHNRAMLSINEMLGFVKQPIWMSFVKTLRTENREPRTEN